MRFGVVIFPGSNCDSDCYHALKDVMGLEAEYIWHKSTDIRGFDAIILPGGFSYGDYLRAGAIARFSPVMKAVEKFARGGGLVLGICNGFQILLEAGLLPGAMMRNDCLQFRCHYVEVKVENAETPFTGECSPGQILRIPIAHGEGNYFAEPRVLEELKRNQQIVLRYHGSNPNGSVDNIAAVINREGNVMGMMPHPERCCEGVLGGTDGKFIFQSMMKYIGWSLPLNPATQGRCGSRES
ncbi:MAG TPA: phosphoribosylformylglycinamidine synthase subunit PurQ [Firmicutes bacterium]|nr:phosphoribosylformylglycinamidine synthase subunit PurQ [Bacillota bacterium]